MPFLKINDTDFNYIEMNESAPKTIVMVHGMFTNMAVFYFKIAQKLSERYHIVLYDMKGHGLTGVPLKGYDLHSMTEDLLEIMEKLNLSKVHLAGYSFGGLIALYAAMHYPDKMDKIAIIEAPNPNDEEPRKMLEKYSRDYLEQYTDNLSKSIRMKPSQRQLDKIDKQQKYLFNETSILDDMVLNREFFKEITQMSIPHETLLLYGTQSDCGEAGRFLHQQLKKSQLFFGEGNHNIPVQNAEWIAEKLDQFF